MQSMLKSALIYRDTYGFSVIPVGADKKPKLKWQEFQSRIAEDKEIQDWWQQWPDANVGIVTGRISNLAVVDIDEDRGFDEIAKYIPESMHFPCATTPSGGQHWYFRMPACDLRLNARTIPGCDLRADGGYVVAPPSKSPKGVYRWTDSSIRTTRIPVIPDAYVARVNQPESAILAPCDAVVEMFAKGRRDNDLFHVAHHLVKSQMPAGEIRQVIEILAHHCKFSAAEAAVKVQSAMERADRKDRNLSEDIRNWVKLNVSLFDVKSCYSELKLVKKDEMATARVVLHNLVKEGVLVHEGKRSGIYRKIENELEVLDWRNATATTYPIELPMDLSSYVKLMPKNLVVVAGAPNAGKTAFLLNIVKDNMQRLPISYFSSEMSEQEMRGRIEKFGLPLDEWNFKSYNRSSNFADVIDPDGCNIIDFVEMHDEFWKIGAIFRDVYEKLNQGIAILAIQKKPNQSLGVGGNVTMEKPRLYLSMDNGMIKIEKGKNWAIEGVNPNGMKLSFKLVQGCQFMPLGVWGEDI